jgi:hypothetical protein
MSIEMELPCTVMTGPSTPPPIQRPFKSITVWIAGTFVQLELFDHLMTLGACRTPRVGLVVREVDRDMCAVEHPAAGRGAVVCGHVEERLSRSEQRTDNKPKTTA